MSECDKKRRRFFCPTKWDFFKALGGLLPHGRAHQSDDWAYDATSPDELPTTMQKWWAAVAEVFGDFSRHGCALLNEFWCSTADDTLALWYLDYGFPDECQDYDNLCAKVAARGGATAQYLEGMARDNGWDIKCHDGRVPHELDVSVGLFSPAMAYGEDFEAEYPKLSCLLRKTAPAHIWTNIQAELGTKNTLGLGAAHSALQVSRPNLVLGPDTSLKKQVGMAGAVAPLTIIRETMSAGINTMRHARIGVVGALSNVQILRIEMEVV